MLSRIPLWFTVALLAAAGPAAARPPGSSSQKPAAAALRRALDEWAHAEKPVYLDSRAWRDVIGPGLAAGKMSGRLASRLRSVLRSRKVRVSAETDAGIRAALRQAGKADVAGGSWPRTARRAGKALLSVTVLPETAGAPLEEFTSKDVPIRKSVPGTSHIVVDELSGFQELDGFGAALTDASAEVLLKLPEHARTAVLKKLFDPVEGIGLSYLRIPIGPTDFTAPPLVWHADPPAGADRLDGFSLARDRPIIQVLQLARKINPQLKLMASPWSPPPGMLSRREGKAILAPEHRAAYARYLVRFLKEYAALDPPITFDTLTPQNEPLYYSSGYPTLEMLPDEEAALVNELAPRMAEAGLATKIIGFDHNWNLWRYADRLLKDPKAGRHVAGIAFHGYGGGPEQQQEIARRHPEKSIHFTELSGGGWTGANQANDLMWDMENVVIGTTMDHTRTVLKWNLALDERHGPKNGGCQDCRGIVTVRDNGTVDFNQDFYALGMASKFVRPGARRIQTLTVAPGIEAVAFKNPDGSKALVMSNRSSSPQRVDVASGRRSMSAEIPARAAATLVWD